MWPHDLAGFYSSNDLDAIYVLHLSLVLFASAYLNDVTTKGSPQALLFRIVELIIGEVPGVLDFRLGHVLS